MTETPISVRVHRSNRSLVVYGDDHELEVTFEPADSDVVVVRELPDGRRVVGYLSYDDDCQNPLEDSDGSGRVFDRRRDYGGKEAEQAFREAMAIDEYGDRIEGEKPDPYAVMLDVYSHSGDVWRVHGGGKYFPDEQWDVSNGAGVWVPDPACREHIEMAAVQNALPGVVMVCDSLRKRPDGSYYTTYGFKFGGRERKGYKTVLNAARQAAKKVGVTWASFKELFEKAAREEAVKCAEQALETYNDWLSGANYGVVVEVFKPGEDEPDDEKQDACWGFVGTDYAMQSLREEVDSTVARLTKPREAPAEAGTTGESST
jgi:hypothetical protein